MLETFGDRVIGTFLTGVISFLSPCVLPLVSGYVSYVAGRTSDCIEPGRLDGWCFPAAGLSICFVLGFSSVFAILGARATALGQSMPGYRYELNLIVGAFTIVFSLFMLGMTRLAVLERKFRFHFAIPGTNPFSAYILGLAFGIGWTPCIGPTLMASAASAPVAVTLLGI